MSTVAIVGGGLAGLACAKMLVDAGVSVEVFEGLPFLGGRASTWRDEDGDWIEQGLHLYLGVYSELSALLADVGSPRERTLRFMTEVKLQAVGAREGLVAVNPLRAPLTTARRLLADHRALGPIEKLHAALVAAPAVRGLSALERDHDAESVHTWWYRVSGNDRLLERFVRPFCRGIQFTEPEELSAFNFLTWFHHFTRQPADAVFGAYLAPREEMMFQPLARSIEERGGVIHCSRRLRRVVATRRSGAAHVQRLVFEDGSEARADVYVLALPFWELLPTLSPLFRHTPFFERIARLPVAPAISVQLFVEGKVVPTEHFTLVGASHACVYQDLSTNQFEDDRGSRISVIVSPADALLDEDDDLIVARVLADLARAAPWLEGIQVRKSVVLKHRQHLLRPAPGVMAARPTQVTPVPNLYIAGDWTKQAFHSSQEGAVRSGHLAASAVLEALPVGRAAFL